MHKYIFAFMLVCLTGCGFSYERTRVEQGLRQQYEDWAAALRRGALIDALMNQIGRAHV
mgnify:CR=1 FL=1